MAQVRSGNFRGVGLVNLDSRAVKPVDAFGATDYQAGGSYDGAVALWKEYRSLNGLDDFVVKEWSSANDTVRIVGRSHSDPRTGQPYPSPWTDPSLGGGYAAWVEGVDSTGKGDLVVLDVESGRRRVFSNGHPGGVLIYRHRLIWMESTSPGAQTTVFAKDLKTGRTVEPPRALADQRGAYSLATDGTGIAWIGADGHRLYYSPDGLKKGETVLQLKHGGFNPPTVVHAGVVMTGYSGGVLAANAEGVSTRVVKGGGGVTSGPEGFLVGQPNFKGITRRLGVASIEPSILGRLSCTDDQPK